LRKLGVFDEPKSSRVLDLCCGHGEALEVMYENGFRDLAGLDWEIDPKTAADPRFRCLAGDALNSNLADGTYDVITCLHSVHHFGTPDNVRKFMSEVSRLLKPGGRLYILDFENTIGLRTVLRVLRMNGRWPGIRYLKNLSTLIREEWPFLKTYLEQWGEIRECLNGGGFASVGKTTTMFYFYLALRKPET
jgi:SAM-dependent methyltransferase